MTDYLRPKMLDEVLQALSDRPELSIVAGGTDWMVPVRGGTLLPKGVLNVFRVEELRQIAGGKGTLEIGACVTVARLLKTKEIFEGAPLLWKAADRFASPLVRARATVGGNLVNASPAADLSLALLASDAQVNLASRRGRRSLPVEQFVLGVRKTALQPGELVVSVTVPLRAGQVTRFEKSGTRPALEISAAAVAFAATVKDGRVLEPRIACGAVAPVPMRATGAEALVAGKVLDADLIEACAVKAASEIRPIDDLRATARYRRRLVGAFVGRCLAACAQGHAGGLHAARG